VSRAAPAIEGRGLTKVYGEGATEVTAIRGVDLAVERGEVVALLGPSGAGKSTLLMALGFVEAPTQGELLVEGVRVSDGPVRLVDVRALRRERVGFVFQRSNLIPFLDAEENVALPLGLSGVADAAAIGRARELLEALGVEGRAKGLPHQLSGGQQQRVAIARALANRPALLLADEPTAALDGQRGRQVMELFRGVARDQGAAVVVVTHDHRALDVFDRILEVEDGRLAAAEPGALAARAQGGGCGLGGRPGPRRGPEDSKG